MDMSHSPLAGAMGQSPRFLRHHRITMYGAGCARENTDELHSRRNPLIRCQSFLHSTFFLSLWGNARLLNSGPGPGKSGIHGVTA